MVMVAIDSASVGSSRLAISSITVFLKKNDFAEIAAQDVGEPDEELGEDRLVEAEPVADRRDLLGIGVVAGDDRRGIARRQAQHEEHQHRDDQHHRRGRDEAAQDIADHFTSTFQKAIEGAASSPVTPLRQATGWTYCPSWMWVGYSTARSCTASAIAFCLPGSVSRGERVAQLLHLGVARPAERRLVAARR